MSIFKEGGLSILIAYVLLALVCAFNVNDIARNDKRVKALEVRLQNVEHLLSLSISESRSPASTNYVNRVRASSDAP